LGVLAYSGSDVTSGFGGPLASCIVHPIKAVNDAPLRIEERAKKVPDGAGGVVEQTTKFPIWFDPKSSGGTPMCAALTKAAETLVEWCNNHPKSYPPTVLHVTDGQSTDGVPEEIANNLRQITTQDGQCLLFNLHVTVGHAREVVFPTSDAELTDEYARLLFRMSSPLSTHLLREATKKGYTVNDGS